MTRYDDPEAGTKADLIRHLYSVHRLRPLPPRITKAALVQEHRATHKKEASG